MIYNISLFKRLKLLKPQLSVLVRNKTHDFNLALQIIFENEEMKNYC